MAFSEDASLRSRLNGNAQQSVDDLPYIFKFLHRFFFLN